MAISNLKKVRLLSEMTQEEFCKMLGVSQSYLSLLERGKREPTKEIETKINEVLKVSYEI